MKIRLPIILTILSITMNTIDSQTVDTSDENKNKCTLTKSVAVAVSF